MKFFSYLCTEEIRTVFTPARIVCNFFKHTKTRKEARVLAPLRENKTYY